jgi:predicted KAP-like P-loop ATPase
MKKVVRDVTESDMPSILDRELSDLSKDAFGHQYLTDALRNLIEGSHLPPYSIGLLGSWGTGKSTIKQLYLESVKSDSTGTRGKRRNDRIHPITFNAWRYGGDQDLKRALLRHTFIELGGDEPELRRELYHQVTETAQSRRSFKEWLVEAVLQNLASVGIFVVMFAAVMAIQFLNEILL